jgi:diaminohydroxyphosphoribosylaminopyrimidine deaminase / 5-amino-6-(5-phosphoribosylamino)uracil reductase
VDDVVHMARALAIAERGRASTSPNPLVGAVVVDHEGVVVGAGAHEVAGGPHAEVYALAAAGERARGATLYCTLEPCCHTGRTGPCAPLVVQAGVRRAVVAVEDPNPRVAGRGLAYLRDHGLEVTVGVLAREATRQNAAFFTVMHRRRPFVTMKAALSQDRKVAAAPGVRTRLTGPAADRIIHRERAAIDALAVGSGTMVADDPLLTARGAYRPRPLLRVVFDRRLRTPHTARMFTTLAEGPVMVATASLRDGDARRRAEALRGTGAEVREFDGTAHAYLTQVLEWLAEQGVTSLTIEGGPTLHRAVWDAGLVDRVQIFATPKTLGPAGLPWLDAQTLDVERLVERETVRLGDDVMIEGYVHRTG